MDKFPIEIIGLIVQSVDEKSTLRNLRLTSKVLSVPATEVLFSKCTINIQELYVEGDDSDSDEVNNESSDEEPKPIILPTNLEKIQEVQTLAKAIRTIRYITNLHPNQSKWEYWGSDDSDCLEFTLPMKKLIRMCNKFPNLTRIEVEFGSVCGVEQEDDAFSDEPQETHAYRTSILKTLFAALNDPKNPTPNLTTISLKNLQNFNDPGFTKSRNFLDVLKRITNLRLSIITQGDIGSPESSWRIPQMHDFFTELPSTWLQPCAENLTSLTLHCDDFWGYFPKCDLRDLHFPKLKKLELGNYTFTHDWQLDWILSHGNSLEKLVFDDCSIVLKIKQFGRLDAENYPVKPREDFGDSPPIIHYSARWNDYFHKLSDGLLKLRIFKIGKGIWEDGQNFDGKEFQHIGTSSSLYKCFNRGIGPSPWIETVKEFNEMEDIESGMSEESDAGSQDLGSQDTETREGRKDRYEYDLAYKDFMGTLETRQRQHG